MVSELDVTMARGWDLNSVRNRLTVHHGMVAVIVAVWALLYLNGLGDHPLRVWDESRYANPARHMVGSGSWLDPRIRVNTHSPDLGLTPRLVKPPLVYWLQATSMSAFGITTFATRLPSALAALGCAGVVYRVGQRTYDYRAGLAGALVLLVFPGLLLGSHGGRAAVTDTTLTLFGSLFVWFTWRGRNRPRLLVPAGLCAGLAVMTKGVAAGVFVVVLLPVLLRFARSYRTPWTVAAVVTTIVVAVPWHLYTWLRHGDEFVEQYFLTAVASRVEGEMTGPPVEPIFEFMNYPYFRFAVDLFVPPYPYALPAFGLGLLSALVLIGWLVRRDGLAHQEKLFLVWWAAAVPLTFAVAGGNHPWYLIPMYVPGAVLVGYVPAAVVDGTVGTAICRASKGTVPRVPVVTRVRQRSRFQPLATGSERTISAVRTAAYVAVCLVVTVLLVTSYAPGPAEPHDRDQRAIGDAVATEVPAEEPIHVWIGGSLDRPDLMAIPFYADRPLVDTSLEELCTDSRIRYAIVPSANRDCLDRSHSVLVESPTQDVLVVEFPSQ